MLTYVQESKDTFLNPFLPLRDNRPWNAVPSQTDPDRYWSFLEICPFWDCQMFGVYWNSYLAEWRGGPRYTDDMGSPLDKELQDLVVNAKLDAHNMDPSILWPTSYAYSAAFLFGNHFPGGEITPEDLHLNTLASVTYPSNKVLIFGGATGTIGGAGFGDGLTDVRATIPLGLVDGSVYMMNMSDHVSNVGSDSSGIITPSNTWPCVGRTLRGYGDRGRLGCDCGAGPSYFWSTRGGAGGRDFNR